MSQLPECGISYELCRVLATPPSCHLRVAMAMATQQRCHTSQKKKHPCVSTPMRTTDETRVRPAPRTVNTRSLPVGPRQQTRIILMRYGMVIKHKAWYMVCHCVIQSSRCSLLGCWGCSGSSRWRLATISGSIGSDPRDSNSCAPLLRPPEPSDTSLSGW